MGFINFVKYVYQYFEVTEPLASKNRGKPPIVHDDDLIPVLDENNNILVYKRRPTTEQLTMISKVIAAADVIPAVPLATPVEKVVAAAEVDPAVPLATPAEKIVAAVEVAPAVPPVDKVVAAAITEPRIQDKPSVKDTTAKMKQKRQKKPAIPVYRHGKLHHYIEDDSSEDEVSDVKMRPTKPDTTLDTEYPVFKNGQLIRYIEPNSEEDEKITTVQPNTIGVTTVRKNPTKQQKPSMPSTPSTPPIPFVDWDGWPDGTFECDFTHTQYREAGNLVIHWAHRQNGGYRKETDTWASSWQAGAKRRFSCSGILRCGNPLCNYIVRPHTLPDKVDEQLQKPCHCGSELRHLECSVEMIIYIWKGGVHYQNSGTHYHVRPTHKLHLLNNEKRRFSQLVFSHPASGPQQLITGVPGVNGPGESVADISDVLLNPDRVSKERQKIKYSQTPEDIFQSFSAFANDHPDFLLHSEFGSEIVISFQSPFMRSQMVKNELLDGSVNGLASDAAHGWWAEKNHLLMFSSTYCLVLHCWVPGVVSFLSGASALHFEHHFFAVIVSIVKEATLRQIPLTDELFAGVMDVSEAERLGFINAFVRYWDSRSDNKRSRQDLRVAAENLLKDLPDSDEFLKHCQLLLHNFPKIKSWIGWWTRPSHAQMLFQSERKMDAELWDSLPATTNAEESMHCHFYIAAGKGHRFMEGLNSIYKVILVYERRYSAETKGALQRYGQSEPWKLNVEKFGRTKPSRANVRGKGRTAKYKNDGRPPDTAKALLKDDKKARKTTKSIQNQQTTKDTMKTLGPPGYRWNTNSCWLDTSLQLLYVAFTPFFEELTPIFSLLPEDNGLRQIYYHLLSRNSIDNATPPDNAPYILATQRNAIRTMLMEVKAIESTTGYKGLFGWFHHLLRITEIQPTF